MQKASLGSSILKNYMCSVQPWSVSALRIYGFELTKDDFFQTGPELVRKSALLDLADNLDQRSRHNKQRDDLINARGGNYRLVSWVHSRMKTLDNIQGVYEQVVNVQIFSL